LPAIIPLRVIKRTLVTDGHKLGEVRQSRIPAATKSNTWFGKRAGIGRKKKRGTVGGGVGKRDPGGLPSDSGRVMVNARVANREAGNRPGGLNGWREVGVT